MCLEMTCGPIEVIHSQAFRNVLHILRNKLQELRRESQTLRSKSQILRNKSLILLITGGSGSGKTKTLLNLIENQPDIDKIYLYAKDTYESKYQYLINKRESVGVNHFKDPKDFIEYSKILMISILILIKKLKY